MEKVDILSQRIKAKIIAAGGHQRVYVLDLSKIQTQCLTQEAKQILQKCPNLYQLNLSGCGLRSLNNFPKIDLTIVMLQENKLIDEQIHKLNQYPNLVQISLNKNMILYLKTFKSLTQLHYLQQLDIRGNPFCTNDQQYFQKLFKIFAKNQKLKIIDCFRRNGTIISDQDNKDEELMYQQWMDKEIDDEESENDRQSEEISQGGLFVDPILNCFDEDYNNLQLDLDQEEEKQEAINGVKKIKF